MKIQTAACLMALFFFLTTSEGMSLGVELHCRCIQTESKLIAHHIDKAEVFPADSHCEHTEIIATLKDGQRVCLNPEAPWVKKVLKKMLSSRKL